MKDLKKIMVALDNMSEQEIFSFLDKTSGEIVTVKIGLEMFCKYGPQFIHSIYDKYKSDIFLDLKLHDIPNTVKKSIHALKDLPIKFLTIHLSGGSNMIDAAMEAARESLPDTKILGVSFLTSLDEKELEHIFGFSSTQVPTAFQRLFSIALKSSIDGVVLSAIELAMVKKLEIEYGREVIKVCPGIRFQDEIEKNQIGDQKRVLSPHAAFTKGANFLVMGRSLTTSKNLSIRINELLEITFN